MLQNSYEGMSLLPLRSRAQCSGLTPGAGVRSRLLCGGEGARALRRGHWSSGFPAVVTAGGARDGVLASLTEVCVVRPDLSQCSGKMA